jgi:hypothetical protein
MLFSYNYLKQILEKKMANINYKITMLGDDRSYTAVELEHQKWMCCSPLILAMLWGSSNLNKWANGYV